MADLPDVLSPGQICAHLQITTTRPDKWIKARQAEGLEVVKLGRSVRVTRRALTKFLEGCTVVRE